MLELDTQFIDLPTFGRCTMIPLSKLPEGLRSYARMRETAKEMGLQEFKDLSHKEIQEISRAVALHFRESASIFLAYVVEAYPIIFPSRVNQKMEECVGVIELITYELPQIETYINYVPVESVHRISEQQISMCLFRGSVA
jgi:hypothetical protein